MGKRVKPEVILILLLKRVQVVEFMSRDELEFVVDKLSELTSQVKYG